MPTVLLLNNQRYDVDSDDPTGVRTLLAATPTSFSFINSEGTSTTLVGSGFTYGTPADGPLTGSIARVDVGGEGAGGAVALRIVGPFDVAPLPANLVSSRDAFFGSLLAGDDTLDLRGGDGTPSTFSSSLLAGDAIRVEGSATGSDDRFFIGNTAGQFVGDIVFVSSDATLRGGDDTMVAGTATLVGDASQVGARGVLVGGDDTLTLAGEGIATGDTFRMLFGGQLLGGEDTIEVGGGTVYGDANEVDDFGDALILRGGRDTITVNGAAGATIFGDIQQMILERQLPGGAQIVFGADRVNGGAGDDTIYGDARFASTSVLTTLGNDVILGRAGDDTIFADVATLGSGTSAALFRGGDDLVYAGAGDDMVMGFVGNDRLFGQQGADLLMGESGNDRLFGNLGNDTLMGGTGNDLLFGQDGNDVLDGGKGRDVLDGGAGFDIASFATADQAVTVDLLRPNAGVGAAEGDALRSIEGVTGTRAADTLVGTNARNVLEGGAGNDRIGGRGGNDVLRGGEGADRLFGADGFDTLDGGAGADVLVGGTQNDAASYQSAEEGVVADLLARGRNTGDAAGDVYVGIENLIGSASDDELLGTNGANVLIGGAGNDTLVGRAGDDVVIGGAGADTIGGGGGNDVIRGGVGADVLFGGAGADRFVYADATEGLDVIRDFRRGQDVIDLSGIDANATVAGDQAFRFVAQLTGQAGQLAYADGVVGADLDGDARVDFIIFVENVFALGPRDFVL